MSIWKTLFYMLKLWSNPWYHICIGPVNQVTSVLELDIGDEVWGKQPLLEEP
jgi:hypothetical protein